MANRWARTAAVAVGAAALVMFGVGISSAISGTASAPAKGAALRQESAGGVPAGYQPVPDEGVYTPIAPCRLVNTSAKGGPVTSARSFVVSGTSSLAAQGGTVSGCAIPASATGVSAIVTAFHANPGYIRAYATGSAVPTGALFYFATTTVTAPATLPIRPGTAAGLTLQASTAVNIAVDITGYYAPQITAYVSSAGGIAGLGSGTSRILSLQNNSSLHPGVFTLTVDRDVYDCSAMVTPADAGTYASAETGHNGTITVQTWELTNGQVNLEDYPFQLSVVC